MLLHLKTYILISLWEGFCKLISLQDNLWQHRDKTFQWHLKNLQKHEVTLNDAGFCITEYRPTGWTESILSILLNVRIVLLSGLFSVVFSGLVWLFCFQGLFLLSLTRFKFLIIHSCLHLSELSSVYFSVWVSCWFSILSGFLCCFINF